MASVSQSKACRILRIRVNACKANHSLETGDVDADIETRKVKNTAEDRHAFLESFLQEWNTEIKKVDADGTQ